MPLHSSSPVDAGAATHCLISVDGDMLRFLPRNLLRDGDALVVSAGGRRLAALEQTVRDARALGLPVYASCGTRRLAEVSTLPVDRLLLDWEPSTWDDAGWNFARNYTRLTTKLQDSRIRAIGLLVTAVPLNPRQGHSWEYQALSALYSPVILQTQGFLKRSLPQRLIDAVRRNTQFEESLFRLRAQHSDRGLERVGFQVAFEGDAAVSPQTAAKATRAAASYGVTTVYIFGRDALDLRRYLLAIGRVPG